MEATEELVQALVAEQFPQWSDLAVAPVPKGGWSNRTFRLGKDMLVRLPSAERYAAQIPKECGLLPRLAADLPLTIPPVRAMGKPSLGYPYSWSVLDWIEGDRLPLDGSFDLTRVATDLGAFLKVLQAILIEGPPPGPHNFWRGGPLATYDQETRDALVRLGNRVPGDVCLALWEEALDAPFAGPDVWLHGDISPANLLVHDGCLTAVIDFGGCAVGDPACDYAIAWTSLPFDARRAFRQAVGGDEAVWLRGRGWALWKALICLAGEPGLDGPTHHAATLKTILTDPVF